MHSEWRLGQQTPALYSVALQNFFNALFHYLIENLEGELVHNVRLANNAVESIVQMCWRTRRYYSLVVALSSVPSHLPSPHADYATHFSSKVSMSPCVTWLLNPYPLHLYFSILIKLSTHVLSWLHFLIYITITVRKTLILLSTD